MAVIVSASADVTRSGVSGAAGIAANCSPGFGSRTNGRFGADLRCGLFSSLSFLGAGEGSGSGFCCCWPVDPVDLDGTGVGSLTATTSRPDCGPREFEL